MVFKSLIQEKTTTTFFLFSFAWHSSYSFIAVFVNRKQATSQKRQSPPTTSHPCKVRLWKGLDFSARPWPNHVESLGLNFFFHNVIVLPFKGASGNPWRPVSLSDWERTPAPIGRWNPSPQHQSLFWWPCLCLSRAHCLCDLSSWQSPKPYSCSGNSITSLGRLCKLQRETAVTNTILIILLFPELLYFVTIINFSFPL